MQSQDLLCASSQREANFCRYGYKACLEYYGSRFTLEYNSLCIEDMTWQGTVYIWYEWLGKQNWNVLDLCQLPLPPYENHKKINLPAFVKIFKNKLKNWETDNLYFHLPQPVKNYKLIKFLLSCHKVFHIFQYKFNKIWKLLTVTCHINLISHLQHGFSMMWVN